MQPYTQEGFKILDAEDNKLFFEFATEYIDGKKDETVSFEHVTERFQFRQRMNTLGFAVDPELESPLGEWGFIKFSCHWSDKQNILMFFQPHVSKLEKRLQTYFEWDIEPVFVSRSLKGKELADAIFDGAVRLLTQTLNKMSEYNQFCSELRKVGGQS